MSRTNTKIELLDTTLICVDSRSDGVNKSIKALERCKQLVNFGAVKLLTHLDIPYPHKVEIKNISSHLMYSVFMLKEIYKYVDTKYMLIVQSDGWILNPDAWDDSWKNYDYMGPLFNQYDIVGNGGFSFRSRALMKFVSQRCVPWDVTEEGANKLQQTLSYYEDGVISMEFLPELNARGFCIAPPEVACKFAQGGNPNNNYYCSYPFGFHGSWRSIDQQTGFVDSEIKHDWQIPEPL